MAKQQTRKPTKTRTKKQNRPRIRPGEVWGYLEPRTFESTGKEGDVPANVYLSMMYSPAWQDLTPTQHHLYLGCKARYYGQIEKPFNKLEYFTLPRRIWSEELRLYDITNWFGFSRDMTALVIHGFIIAVSDGKETTSDAIYKFSDMWQLWGTRDFMVLEGQMPSYTKRRVKAKYWTPSVDLGQIFRPDTAYWDGVFAEMEQNEAEIGDEEAENPDGAAETE